MLETQIKLLTAAVQLNTSAILAQQEVSQDRTNKTSQEPLDDTCDAEPEAPTITTQLVKELAKSKMSDGVPRKTIKDVITKLNADSIADLDDDGLASLHKTLSAMR